MSLKKFSFNVINKDGFARLGQIKTHRGNIDTLYLCLLERRLQLKVHSLKT